MGETEGGTHGVGEVCDAAQGSSGAHGGGGGDSEIEARMDKREAVREGMDMGWTSCARRRRCGDGEGGRADDGDADDTEELWGEGGELLYGQCDKNFSEAVGGLCARGSALSNGG